MVGKAASRVAGSLCLHHVLWALSAGPAAAFCVIRAPGDAGCAGGSVLSASVSRPPPPIPPAAGPLVLTPLLIRLPAHVIRTLPASCFTILFMQTF